MKAIAKTGLTILATALSLLTNVQLANAQAFYADKTIEIIVPLGPGGQMDIATRVLSQYLERFIEGNPKVRVVNVTGAGGITGANRFEVNTKRDGLHFLMTGTATVFDWVSGRSTVRFDFKKMHPLLAAPNPSVVFFPKKLGIKTVKDILNPAEPLVSGTVSPTGPELPTYMMFSMAGILDRVRVVQGYTSGNDVTMAFLSDENNLGRNSHGSFEQRFGKQIADGDVIPVYTHGLYDAEGKYVADPKRPDLPNLEGAYQILTGKTPSGDFWDATMLINKINVTGGVNFAMHLDDPEDAKKAMDKAMAALVKDAKFKDDMGKIFGAEYQIISGDALMVAHKNLTSASPALVKIVKDFLVEKFKHSFAD